MSNRIVLLAACGFALGLTGKAVADIAPPLPPAKTAVAVKIEVDANAKGPKLILPNGVIVPPRIRPGPPRKGPNGQLQNDNGDSIADNSNESEEIIADQPAPTHPKTGIMVAGLALALSMAFGGLWLFRRNGKGSVRTMGVLIAAGIGLSIGTMVWANAAPPPFVKERPKPPAAMPTAWEGKTDVEFVFGVEPVRLILDKESYDKLKKGELKAVEPNAQPKPNTSK